MNDAHPSEVMPLLWPEVSGNAAALAPGTIQLGVSVEPLGAILLPCLTEWLNVPYLHHEQALMCHIMAASYQALGLPTLPHQIMQVAHRSSDAILMTLQ